MLDLYDQLETIARVFAEHGVRYSLVGGLAYSIWVEIRATEDIDLLIHPDHWPRVAELLASHGFRSLADDMDFDTIRIRRLTKIEKTDVVTLDLLLADPPLDRLLQSSASIIRGDTRIHVAQPNALIQLKKLRSSPRDELDIAGLKRVLDAED